MMSSLKESSSAQAPPPIISTPTELPLGATYLRDGSCSFLVWAPKATQVELEIIEPEPRIIPLEQATHGFWSAIAQRCPSGTKYYYRLDGVRRPDPASRLQPEGVHGASMVVGEEFSWMDDKWRGVPLQDYVIYELHVGTFSREGTFEGIIPHLAGLKDLGITVIELMPIAQFPGTRNWGYDGVYPFAPQHSYGGPEGLKKLVDACHGLGIGVMLDVVYNHFGPEGNYLREFGPYFTERYRTPWGDAINFDGPGSDGVRRFFLENAIYWQKEFHLDGLRLDAVHAIYDHSAAPFLQELVRTCKETARGLHRHFTVIAESDLNDPRLIRAESAGGLGLDAQWADDFHHCLHVLLTGEREGYYQDYGGVAQFGKVFREGYAYTGQYSPFRGRRHGATPTRTNPRQFVVCAQNHDQIGNRCQGDRLSFGTDFGGLKLAAGAIILSPFTPLLFMGEEYGEPAPFQYMISHTDPDLIEAVRKGRCEEFSSFNWQTGVPDPFAEETFSRCVLNHDLIAAPGKHQILYAWYQELLRQRRSLPAIHRAQETAPHIHTWEEEQVLAVHYTGPRSEALLVLCFAHQPVTINIGVSGGWQTVLDSSAPAWGGEGDTQIENAGEGWATFRLNPKSLLLLANTKAN